MDEMPAAADASANRRRAAAGERRALRARRLLDELVEVRRPHRAAMGEHLSRGGVHGVRLAAGHQVQQFGVDVDVPLLRQAAQESFRRKLRAPACIERRAAGEVEAADERRPQPREQRASRRRS